MTQSLASAIAEARTTEDLGASSIGFLKSLRIGAWDDLDVFPNPFSLDFLQAETERRGWRIRKVATFWTGQRTAYDVELTP